MSILDLMANLFLLLSVLSAASPSDFETDTLKTFRGDLKIAFIGHGTLMFRFDGKVILVTHNLKRRESLTTKQDGIIGGPFLRAPGRSNASRVKSHRDGHEDAFWRRQPGSYCGSCA